jgi:hypothetical protein
MRLVFCKRFIQLDVRVRETFEMKLMKSHVSSLFHPASDMVIVGTQGSNQKWNYFYPLASTDASGNGV